MARPGAVTLAVFGTGEQARLQAIWLAKLRPVSAVLVHGRNPHKAAALCATSKRTACLPGRLRHNRRSPPTPAHRRRHRVSHQAGGASRWWTAGKSAE
ncbi:hypothetical protein ACFQ2K_09060 [Streptomyces sanglieri]|uniref:Uncharacterized protein n=1 Tax=Streptomyces sanglieri TaxID=193460 RepID=A0ABW2WNF5_9ACTN